MKKGNNSGFTLVELLIAITILGIIVGPFMHSFVTAARTNAKAQQIQNATLLATNIMEEVKSNDMGDLAFQFNYPKRADGSSRFDIMSTYSAAYEMVSKNNTLQNVTKYLKNGDVDNRQYVTSSVLYEDYQTNNTDDYELLGQELGKYYFVMEGLEAGASKYDALIKMDAAAYKTIDDKGYNDQPTAVIESLDILEDAFYVQPAKQDVEFATDIAKEAKIGNYQTVLDAMKRKITIDIDQEGVTYRVYVTYEYTYGTYTRTVSHLIYSNSESPDYSLKSIYLFYVPNYTSNLEEIIINNNDNVKANVYLIKQRVATTDVAGMAEDDALYKCRVSVRENVLGFNASSHRAYLSVRTNLGYNLYLTNTPVGTQVTYRYIDANNQYRENLVEKMLDVNTLDGKGEKDRIYEVTVSIYKKGEAANLFAGEPVATITGSKDN